ncbi:MAG TPA: hypothetical protein VG077_00195 [Verrucomicrobiae bacterium]|nr:hypothetical protein [Verrucomicrobiae bacterium]
MKMNKHVSYLCGAALFLGAALFNQSVHAQLVLTGTNYVQDFNAISNGLPFGWSVRLNASVTNLGTNADFPTVPKTWGDSKGGFGNCASAMSNSGTNFIGTESTSIQSNCPNRALAIRQTGTFGDPGASFVLQIANTIGLSNLTFGVDLDLLRTNSNSTTWVIQYGIGDSPSSFTTLGDYSDPGVFGATTRTYNLGTNANNTSSNVWIRIAALSPASGSGTRDTFGIDNFSLSWNNRSAPGAPLAISHFAVANGQAQIDFTGSASDGVGAFVLQTADQVSGPYTEIGAGATITQVNPANFHAAAPLKGSRQFYRIKRP